MIQQEAVKLIEFRQLLRSGGAVKLTPDQTFRQKTIDEATALLLRNSSSPEDFLNCVSYSKATKHLCDNFDVVAEDDIDNVPSTSQPIAIASTSRSATNRTQQRTHVRNLTATVTSETIGNSMGEIAAPPTRSTTTRTARNRTDNEIGATSTSRIASTRSATNRARVIAQEQARLFTETAANALIATSTGVAADVVTTSVEAQPRTTNGKECIACCDSRRSVVFTPCKHCVYCNDCYHRDLHEAMVKYQLALNSWKGSGEEPSLIVLCPICKTKVDSIIDVILS